MEKKLKKVSIMFGEKVVQSPTTITKGNSIKVELELPCTNGMPPLFLQFNNELYQFSAILGGTWTYSYKKIESFFVVNTD